MTRYDNKWSLHDYLNPLFDTVGECTAASRSVSSSLVEMQGETMCKSASSKISSLDQRQSSSAAIGHSKWTTSNPASHGSTSSA